jgi:hypothetical protein
VKKACRPATEGEDSVTEHVEENARVALYGVPITAMAAFEGNTANSSIAKAINSRRN